MGTTNDGTRAGRAPSVLAVLYQPNEHEGSRWHRPRPLPALAELVALVAKTDLARTIEKDDRRATVAVDTKDGRYVRLDFATDRVTLSAILEDSAYYDESHGTWVEDDHVNDSVHGVAVSMLELLQGATGWYVDTLHYDEFDPAGACPACGSEHFEWQEACPVCRKELSGASPASRG